jgi:hypothetical protein
MSAMPNSTLYAFALDGVLLTTAAATLYGLWQAVSGRRGSALAAASMGVVLSIAVFYLTALASSLVTRQSTTMAIWLGLCAAVSSFAFSLAHHVRRHKLTAMAVTAASLFGLFSSVVLSAFLGVFLGCWFGDCGPS